MKFARFVRTSQKAIFVDGMKFQMSRFQQPENAHL